MASREVEDLVPELQEKAKAFSEGMVQAGIDFIFTQTLRHKADQEALYAQGRKQLTEVNRLRKLAGMAPIRGKQNIKVTWTMKSKHLEGKAFDIAVKQDGKITWAGILYVRAGEIGESVGLKWGGRFSKPDMPHFELHEETENS